MKPMGLKDLPSLWAIMRWHNKLKKKNYLFVKFHLVGSRGPKGPELPLVQEPLFQTEAPDIEPLGIHATAIVLCPRTLITTKFR